MKAVVAVAYVVAVVLLTLPTSTFAYFLRGVLLFPLSLPLLVLDYSAVILLFGPDPHGWAPTLFVCLTATAAALLQVSGFFALFDQWRLGRGRRG